MRLNIWEKLTPRTHVGYVVEDVDRCLRALQETLCCAEEVSSYVFTPVRARACGMPIENLSVKIAMCPVKGDVYVEYIQPLSPGGFHYLSFLSAGDAMNHAAFCTDEYEACREEFRRLGAVFVFEAEANDPQNGYRRCFYAKLDGVPGVLEILENATAYRP